MGWNENLERGLKKPLAKGNDGEREDKRYLRMRVQVECRAESSRSKSSSTFAVHCGKGKQACQWLACTAAGRFCAASLPVELRFDGLLVHPHARIRDVVRASEATHGLEPLCLPEPGRDVGKAGTGFVVTVAIEMRCGSDGVPAHRHSLWQDVAFGHGDAARERLEAVFARQEEKRAELEALARMERIVQTKLAFLREVHARDREVSQLLARSDSDDELRDDDSPGHAQQEEKQQDACEAELDEASHMHNHEEVTSSTRLWFYSSGDGSGMANSATRDWRQVRPGLQKLLKHDAGDLSAVRKLLSSNYRVLRDTFNMYSGMDADNNSSMSFQEFLLVLADSQACEKRDADVVAKLIGPVFSTERFGTGTLGLGHVIALVPIQDIHMTRANFLECFFRVLESPEISNTLNLRLGVVAGDATERSPTSRLRTMLRTVVPQLESKTCSRAVRDALTQEATLYAFAERLSALKGLFVELATRKSGAPSSSFSSSRAHPTSGLHVSMRGFVSLLQRANALIDVDHLHHSSSTATVAEPNPAAPRKLTVAEARGLFSASRADNADRASPTAVAGLSFKEFIESIVRAAIFVGYVNVEDFATRLADV